MEASRLVPALALVWALGSTSFGALTVERDERVERLIVKNGTTPVLVYAHGSNQFKPYIRELYTTSGVNVLLDAPADHLHHHGLMFALHVNGVNFWEEAQTPGRQVALAAPAITAKTSSASITHRLAWVSHSDRNSRAALLVEARKITITVSEPNGEVAVEWTSEFTAKTNIRLHGTAYNGLGLRLAPQFDRVGIRSNPENLEFTKEAKWDVMPGVWASISTGNSGAEATVTMCSAPENDGASSFFSMLNPFAYLSATQGAGAVPLNYQSGEQFSIRYLVTVSGGKRSSESINARYKQWLQETLNKR